ncbi:MAG: DMT family transporter [Gammaproteobacteria bacterium]|nr:DMT family transporter [Gammaproteobacteria bacterium]
MSAPTDSLKGMALGLIGVLMFSPTLPLNRVAVEHFSPTIVAEARLLIAGLCAWMILHLARQPWPSPLQFVALLITGLGIGPGFAYFSALAMTGASAVYGSVILGLLPLATALFAALFGFERPSRGFWLVAIIGVILVLWFASLQVDDLTLANQALFAAVGSAALGYAVGGRLSQALGGWQVICWSLVMCLPLVIWPVFDSWSTMSFQVPLHAWASLLYLCVFSQLIGFFFWYRGLALGGIAKVGQIQLLQPFFTLVIAGILLSEPIGLTALIFAIAICFVVWASKKMPVMRAPE